MATKAILILLTASIVAGEVGVVPQAGPYVALVVVDRYYHGWGFRGWHGWAPPTRWSVECAVFAWAYGPVRGGPLFAIGGSDMQRLQFDTRRWLQVGTDRWPVWIGWEWR